MMQLASSKMVARKNSLLFRPKNHVASCRCTACLTSTESRRRTPRTDTVSKDRVQRTNKLAAIRMFARYAGRCSDCGELFERLTPIYYRPADKRVWHETCYEETAQ